MNDDAHEYEKWLESANNSNGGRLKKITQEVVLKKQ